ncbi:MAG: sigma-70 family RNA polymerase sigma factor [Lentisphaerae bacterium]|nr:sigma-70 family RNA polymerase sigma factor [Lentisphaerota bacterium]
MQRYAWRNSGFSMAETDNELIDRYRGGNVEALERLVDKHRRALFGYIMNMTRDKHEADEVFQDVWLKVIKKLDLYRERNFPGWLVRIARNTIIDRARRRKPAVSLNDIGGNGESLMGTISAPGQDPVQSAGMRELGNRIAAAVDSLPTDQKEVFLMRTQTGLAFKDIAKIQKTSINTTLARMQYAVARLKPLLEEEYAAL